MSVLNSLWVVIGAKTDELEKGIKKASSELRRLGDAAQEVGVALSAAITVPVSALGAASISAAADLDSLTRGLNSVTGSSAETQAQLERLKEIAKLPGLGFEEAIRGSINLQAAGLSADMAERALQAFGNALATVGKGKADLDGVITALTQIAAKGKVSAEEILQLQERLPQIRQAMKDAFGTSDTEVLKKAGIDSETFIGAIIKEFEKLPPVTGGIKNEMENMRDSIRVTLAEIGNALAPAFLALMQAAQPLLEIIKDLAEWFRTLPQPVQTFAIALTAVAAVVGPILVALGGIVSAVGALGAALAPVAVALGTSVAALAGWAAAIAGVVAALAALGVWVYNNWDAIVAVLSQAWEGLSEMWQYAWEVITGYLTAAWQSIYDLIKPVWDPIVAVLSFIWDTVANSFKMTWDAIKLTLEVSWNAIKSAADWAWNAIVSSIMAFLEVVKKIPGAAKLFNLDEAWNNAQKLKTELDKGTESTKKHTEALKGGAPAIDAHALAASKAEEKHKKFNVALLNSALQTAKAAEEARKHASSLDESTYAAQELAYHEDLLAASMDALRSDMSRVVSVSGEAATAMHRLQEATSGVTASTREIEAAYSTLGVTQQKSMADLEAAYATLKTSGVATAQELLAAEKAVLQARIDAARAAGDQINQADADRMAQIDARLGQHAEKQESTWKQLGNQVSTILTDMGKSITDLIFNGGSLKDVLVGTFEEIGKAIVRHFIELGIKKAIEAVGELMTSLGGVGAKIAEVIGIGGGAAADVAGGAAGAAGGAAGSAGGTAGSVAAGVGSGLTGVLTAIGSIGSMVTGIISNFQNAKQETTLNAIEHNTRYTMMYVGERSDGGILGVLFKINEEIAWGAGVKALEQIRTTLSDLAGFLVMKLDSINAEIAWGAGVKAMEAVRDAIGRMQTGINIGSINVTVEHGSDGEAIGAAVASSIRRQFGYAL